MDIIIPDSIPSKSRKAFRSWFIGSKMVKRNKPIVYYHGTTRKSQFTKFKAVSGDIGIHFGTIDQAIDRIRYHVERVEEARSLEEIYARIIPAYLHIKRFITVEDKADDENKDGKAWSWKSVLHRIIVDYEFTSSELQTVKSKLGFIRMLASHGFDGIRYLNEFEGGTYSYSYIVFKPSQIWPIYMGKHNPIKVYYESKYPY